MRRVGGPLGAVIGALLLASCTSPLTELVIVVQTDLPLDAIAITVDSAAIDGRSQEARLVPSDPPGSVGVVHRGGPLGPVRVLAVGLEGEARVVERSARVSFVAGQSRRLDLFLGAVCRGAVCEADSTCARGVCVGESRETVPFDGVVSRFDAGAALEPDAGAIDAGPLEPDTGPPPVDAGPLPDSGPDACIATPEVCNGRDDDCDLSLDEGVVSIDNPLHCGECGRACPGASACDGRSCASDPLAIGIFEGGVCAVAGATREVHCWGVNNQFQFGDGTNTASDTPVANGLTDVVQLEGGDEHVCARTQVGDVYCWGRDQDGRLGHELSRETPGLVTLTAPATAIATGADFSCALLLGGEVYCWGHNHLGQCAQPTTSSAVASPTATGITNAIALGAGELHACAALANGTVECWGRNHFGQSDPSSTEAFFVEPRAVAEVSDVAAQVIGLGGGDGHTCLLYSTGRRHCWGLNGLLQLGRGPAGGRMGPFAIDLLDVPLAMSIGALHGCLLEADGEQRCWGANEFAQLGQSAGAPLSSGDALSLSGGPYRAIAAGFTMSCGRTDEGAVECRGRGRFGDGTAIRTSPSPVRASLPTP